MIIFCLKSVFVLARNHCRRVSRPPLVAITKDDSRRKSLTIR
jgi:hypothetical protein